MAEVFKMLLDETHPLWLSKRTNRAEKYCEVLKVTQFELDALKMESPEKLERLFNDYILYIDTEA